MFLQIAHGANAERIGAVAPHDQRIGIVEAKRFRYPDSQFAQIFGHKIDVHWIASFKNLLHDRAGIFGISVDLSAAERLPKNDSPAHSVTVLGGNSGVVQSSFRD